MSRLPIKHIALFVLCFFSMLMKAQQKEYSKWAEESYAKGDFIGAASYYQILFDKDSANVSMAYKLAESYRGYKAFEKAYACYSFVNSSSQSSEYLDALYYMAMINKMNRNYVLSEKQFNLYLKQSKNKSSFLYQSATQEAKAAKQIQAIIKDSLKCTVVNVSTLNTTHADFSALLINDSTLFYSAMKPLNDDYSIKIFHSTGADSVWKKEELYQVLKNEKGNVANITFNKDYTKFVFSACDEKQSCVLKQCEKSGDTWTAPKALPSEINVEGFNSTHPHWANINGKEFLFFTSNITGGKGKLDIWYSEINNNVFSSPKNAGALINSPGDEITPFYSEYDSSLYFSSDWHPGVGGTDVFSSKVNQFNFSAPKNVGVPINSSRNDQYFFINNNGKGYLSSLREGTLSDNTDAICCADLYYFEWRRKKDVPMPLDTLPYKLVEAYVELPLVLYFHNDEPNKRNRDTVTKWTYMETYDAYKKLVPDYLALYPKGLHGEDSASARADIQRFFDDYVDYGVENLHRFEVELLKYLEQGYSAEVLIKGFASPLTTTSYNVNLSLRRISSLMNYLKTYQNGVYVPYFNGTAANGARLTFIKNPNGEYKSAVGVSDDYYDVRNSIYNPHAAIERRIEVVRVNFIPKEPKEIPYFDNFRKMEIDLDTLINDTVSHKIYLKNTSESAWTVENVGADCSCTKLSWDKQVVEPGDYLVLTFTLNLAGKQGEKHNIISIKKSNNAEYQAIELKYFAK